MHPHFKVSFTILFALFALTACFLDMNAVIAQTNDAQSKLQVANNAVEQAFSAVLQAEKAGANITSLLNRLNGVAVILANDAMIYRNGNESAAIINLNIVTSVASDVKSEATTSGDTAKAAADRALWTTITVSVIGAMALLLTLLLVWRRFKEKPHQDLVTFSRP